MRNFVGTKFRLINDGMAVGSELTGDRPGTKVGTAVINISHNITARK